MHTASTEAYFVLSGHGSVETITTSGFESHPLAPNDVLWFGPGTVHRLVNQDRLEILAIMQNNGLPEAGDAVMTFGTDVLKDPERYADLAMLREKPSSPGAEMEVRGRRDAALEGYRLLRESVIAGDDSGLRHFHEDAVRLVSSRVPGWQELWEKRIAPESARTADWLRTLANGQFDHFAEATVARGASSHPGANFGMCGRLQKWDTSSRP
nr:cupin [Paenarthrobacter ureafaciens]